MPKMKKRGELTDNPVDVDLMDRVRKLKEDMVSSEMEKARPNMEGIPEE